MVNGYYPRSRFCGDQSRAHPLHRVLAVMELIIIYYLSAVLPPRLRQTLQEGAVAIASVLCLLLEVHYSTHAYTHYPTFLFHTLIGRAQAFHVEGMEFESQPSQTNELLNKYVLVQRLVISIKNRAG